MIKVQPIVDGPRVSGTAPPSVSVVIPCYNYGRYLRACVESVLTQKGVRVDVTIVDDASTDDSVSVAEALCADDDRVTLRRHSSNQGHIVTFNDALACATADFVVKMDADDLLTRGSLARSAHLLRSFPTVAFVYGHPQSFSGEPPTDVYLRERNWSIWAGNEWIEHIIRRGHNVIMQPEVMMRRSALELAGGHSAEIPEASDLHLWLRLASVGSVGRVNGPVQGLYRIHDQSMQRTIHSGYLSDLKARRTAFDLFLGASSLNVEDSDGMRVRAHRALARDARRLAVRARDLGAEHTEPVAEYRALAEALDPRKTYRSLASAAKRSRFFRRIDPGRPYRNLEDRILWRRWRRFGI
ncbi:glycosyltransferase involved in cell wall biosynthesis [Cryobacterium sp. CG_9.6]|nr:glycosyltransferase involved in cell wall biosynthesis [Cryobacterium sp. CG_9.6]